MATKGAVAVVVAETAVREARAAAAAAVARAVVTRAVAWMEEPPVACAGSTANHSCSSLGMSMAGSICSRSSPGSSQRTAAYCHTTKAARRSAKRRANSRDRPALTNHPTALMDPDETAQAG